MNTRQGDLADQASGNNEVHIQLKLKQTDAKILQAIEEALFRMEKGTYGICRDCGEPIAPAATERDPVDARLHHLQGKAELVTAGELLDFITAFYGDKLTLRNRHVAAARHVADYNFNNTYQYVINRDDMHVRWLQDAIVDLGGTPEEQPRPGPLAAGQARGSTALGHDRGPRCRGKVRRALDAAGRRASERAPPHAAEGDPRRDASSSSGSSTRRSPAARTSSAAAPTASAPRVSSSRPDGSSENSFKSQSHQFQ